MTLAAALEGQCGKRPHRDLIEFVVAGLFHGTNIGEFRSIKSWRRRARKQIRIFAFNMRCEKHHDVVRCWEKLRACGLLVMVNSSSGCLPVFAAVRCSLRFE